MNRTQVILRNIFSNWTAFAVQAGVVFFLTPYVLENLGDARYGVWILISSITGYYGLLALGFQGGVNQYLTRYLSKRDFENMNRVASTAVATLSGAGLLVLMVSLAMAWLAPSLFNIPLSLDSEVFWCIVIAGSSVCVQMVLFLYSAVFMATQRYDLTNLIGISTRLLSAGLIYGAIRLDFGLIGICVATVGSDIVGFVARWRIAYRIVPQLQVAWSLVNRDRFGEMFSYGMWSFLISIGFTIFVYLDATIIGALMPIAALTPYALAAGLTRYLEQLVRPIDQVFFPAVTDLHARDELVTLRAVYLKGSRFFLVAVGISAVFAGFWAEDFFRLWVGEKYVNGEEFPSVAVLFQILLVAMVGRLLPGLGGQVLLGSLHVRPLAIVTLGEAILNAVLSILLIERYGLIGVALGTLVSVLVVQSLTTPILVGRVLNVSLWEYLQQSALRPTIMMIVLSLVTLRIRELGEPSSFMELFALGALGAVIAAPVALFVGLTREDRTQIVYKQMKAAWSRLARGEFVKLRSTPKRLFPSGLNLRFAKNALPLAMRRRLKVEHERIVFWYAMKRFLKNPEACAHADSRIVRDLIRGWGNEGWSASTGFLAACIDHALKTRGPILECGSGLTTIVVGAIASKRGLRHWALEHSPEWATRVQNVLTEYRIDSVILCTTPMHDHGEFCWYDAPIDAMPYFSLVICDGPPGTTKGGRYGLVKIMKQRLMPGCVILLDDAIREQELCIARRWEAELNASFEQYGSLAPYIELTVEGKWYQCGSQSV